MGRIFIKILLFLIPVYLPVTIIGGLFGIIGAAIGVIVSFVLCLLIIANMDRIILRIYKAHPALPAELSVVEEKVRVLSKRAGIAIPSIYVTDLPLPGSLIIGKSQDKTTVVTPARLLNLLNDEELEAMLAYNIVQVDNNIRMRTLIALITGIFTKAAAS